VENVAHLEMGNCQRTLNLTDEREGTCGERERVRHMPQFTVLQLSAADIHKMQNSKDTFGQRNANRERRTANCTCRGNFFIRPRKNNKQHAEKNVYKFTD